jgi:hypothetical protein
MNENRLGRELRLGREHHPRCVFSVIASVTINM